MSDLKKRVGKIEKILKKRYPGAKCSLDYKKPLELMVATILSAQCTDERVNKVTKDLFKKYKKAGDYADVDIEELEADIRSTGFYRNKAKSIKNCCAALVSDHKSKVPDSMEALVKLAGIGRKTANVILGNAYGKAEGVVVDTHVGRISRRLGLTTQKNAEKVETDLMGLIPKKDWTDFSHRMILFGREICQAKKPKCTDCPLEAICESDDKLL